MRNCGQRLWLGTVLLRQGEVTTTEVERALEAQAENGMRLGEILVAWRAISSGALDRALAVQNGVEPELERGFGTGLRAALERQHHLGRPHT